MLCGSVKTDSSWVGEEAVVAFSSFGYLKELHLQIYCSIPPHPRTTAHLAECKILFSSFVFCNRNRPHNRHLLKVPYKGWGEDSISITIKENLRYGHASKGALNNTGSIKKNMGSAYFTWGHQGQLGCQHGFLLSRGPQIFLQMMGTNVINWEGSQWTNLQAPLMASTSSSHCVYNPLLIKAKRACKKGSG